MMEPGDSPSSTTNPAAAGAHSSPPSSLHRPSVSEKAATAAMTKQRDSSASEDLNDEPRPHLHAKTFLAVFAVCLIYFVQIVNVVGAGAQTNTIAITLNGTASSVWLSSPIAIVTAILSPIVSQAADYWGRRWFLVILTFLGAVGSIIVARATSMNMAIAGFAITGLSYGAQPLLHAVSSEVLPRRYRSWGQAADLTSMGFGGIVALLVGGAFSRTSNATSEGFRNFWYMTTALFAVAALLTLVLYHPPPTARQLDYTFTEKLGKLDWIGYSLLTAGILLFCIGLSWSQNPFPWSNPHVSATFAVGLFLMALLAVYETWLKKDGMFHHSLFRNRNFALSMACLFCEGLAFFAANQYFAFQVGVLYETDALLVGVRYMTAMIVSIAAALLAGLYCAVTKRVRWITVLGFVIFVAFFACMANTNQTSGAAVWGYPVLLGTGMGLVLCTIVTVAQLSTPPELIAVTSGMSIGIRSLGGSVGLAIYNALFTNAMGNLGSNIAKAVVPLGLPASSLGAFIGALTAHEDAAALFQIPGVTPQIAQAGAGALLGTYVKGFQHVWIAAACFVALAAIVAVFLKDPTKEFTMHIDAPVEKDEELYDRH